MLVFVDIIDCENCDAPIFITSSMEGPDGFRYCEDCFHSTFTPCEDCGDAIAPDEGAKFGDYSLCDECKDGES